MRYNENEYMERLVDKNIKDYLNVFGAISVEGPKWCGKTWASSRQAKSFKYLDDEETKAQAELDLDLILNDEKPELIDEWHLLPQVWDKVRRKCDEDSRNGKYILTCSTSLSDDKMKKIYHSGAGRIGKINMYTMSLYESKDSNGKASLQDMYNGTQKNYSVDKPDINDIAYYIVRGGWPRNLNIKKENCSLIPRSYIESILDKDINDDKKRDKNKMKMLLQSLSRNESTIVSNQTLLNDIEEFSSNEDMIESRITFNDYLDTLDRLNLISNQSAYSSNYRSKERLGKSPKRHLTDPSLACAALNLTPDKLLKDLNTFGFLFESLVERDLRIYIEYLGGNLYHFRDNVSGLEVDSILEFADGEYAAVEIKLGYNMVEEAKKNLLKFNENMTKKPKFMCIITSNFSAVVKDPETGIYILPITALRP